MFNSSVKREKTRFIPLNGVIAGWTKGLLLMQVGEKTRLWTPENLAYQEKPGRPVRMLVFDIEFIEIVPSKKSEFDNEKG